ncbi:MAG TPA: zinc ribbon domain-containing protein [Candidatus Tectomicrobia bacterium]|nr:zinc ribbon domain-containing protein [Candidatus Tectomicrobia bacterium]
MNCHCGETLPATAKFCPACGAKAVRPKKCAGCGILLTDTARFCPECGTMASMALEETPATVSPAKHQCELDYRFFDRLHTAFYEPILKTLEEQREDLHDLVRQESGAVLVKDLNAGVRNLLQAAQKTLREHLSQEQLAALADTIHTEMQSLLSGLQSLLDDLTRKGDVVLEEVPRTRLEGLLRGAKIGLANAAGGTAVGGPIGTIGGIVKSIWDGHELDKTHERITNEYCKAREEVFERVDEMWAELYDHIHTTLEDEYSVRTPALVAIQQLYEGYTEQLQEAEKHIGSEEFEEALKCIEQAIGFCPREPEPYVLKGQALCNLERWDDLLHAMDQLRALDSAAKDHLLPSYFYTAVAYCEKDDTKPAIDWLRKLVKPEHEELPYYAFACYLLSICYAKGGDRANCLRYLQQAVDAGYTDAEEIRKEPVFSLVRSEPGFESIPADIKTRTPRLITKFLLEDGSGVFCKPNDFGQDKLAIAKSSYVNLSKGEKIICIYDSTVFGGAKEGVCFTDRGVYWKDLWQDPHSFTYDEISSIEVSDDGVALNGVDFSSDVSLDRDNIVALLKRICPHAELTRAD